MCDGVSKIQPQHLTSIVYSPSPACGAAQRLLLLGRGSLRTWLSSINVTSYQAPSPTPSMMAQHGLPSFIISPSIVSIVTWSPFWKMPSKSFSVDLMACTPPCHAEAGPCSSALAPLAQHPDVAVFLALVHMVVGPEKHTVDAGGASNLHAIFHAHAGRAPRHRTHVGVVGDPVAGGLVRGRGLFRGAWHLCL